MGFFFEKLDDERSGKQCICIYKMQNCSPPLKKRFEKVASNASVYTDTVLRSALPVLHKSLLGRTPNPKNILAGWLRILTNAFQNSESEMKVVAFLAGIPRKYFSDFIFKNQSTYKNIRRGAQVVCSSPECLFIAFRF